MFAFSGRGRVLIIAILMLSGAMPAFAQAQGFAAIASPPRFELTAKAGESIRSVLEITNPGLEAARYSVKSADWSYDDKRNLMFHDAPQAGSCRPWVALEQREIRIAAGARMRFRFEVQAPAGTAPQECRFALMIEGSDPLIRQAQNLSFPVSGRLAVIVYVAVGEARPQLEIVASKMLQSGDEAMPAIRVKNSGIAHGRLAGFLTATDAKGIRHTVSPSTTPILPGDTRDIALQLERQDSPPTYPLTIRGTLEWNGPSIPFEHRFENVIKAPHAGAR